jgi:hypothetical protein
VAGFDVQCAPFHDLSILFNNPGEHCLQQCRSGIFDLANNVYNDFALHFYKILHECVTRLDINFLTNKFLFCALPLSVYHVTRWDRLNYRHVKQNDPQYRSMAQNWLLTCYRNKVLFLTYSGRFRSSIIIVGCYLRRSFLLLFICTRYLLMFSR